MVIMSHLSDAQFLAGTNQTISINNHINFAKYVLQKNPDTTADIDADALWEEFTKTRFFRK